MRLILSADSIPLLLVDAYCKELQDTFKFWVINGNWDGIYDNGTVTVLREDYVCHTVTDMKILCADQKLLIGDDYHEIFNSYNKSITPNHI